MRKEEVAILVIFMSGIVLALAPENILINTPNQSFYTTPIIELNISLAESVAQLNLTLNENTTELCQNCTSYTSTLTLTEGQYNLTITATDGNSITVSQNHIFIIDTPPTATANSLPLFTNQTNHLFTCNATDTIGLASMKLFIWNANGSEFNTTQSNITGTENQVSLNSTFTNDGNYTWNCLASDTSNNEDWDINKSIVIDTAVPVISSFVCSPSHVNKGEAISCPCTASDTGSGLSADPLVHPSTSTSANGTFQVNCTATDRAGNTYTTSTSYTVNQPSENISSQNTETNQPSNTQAPSTRRNATTSSTNTTTTNTANTTSAAEVEVTVENATETGELQQSSDSSTAPVTGAAIGPSRIKSLLPIATFIGMVLFIASFVVFVRKKIVPKKAKSRQKPRSENKYRKSTILE